MADRHPPARHREALATFVEALGGAANALRRDECGDPCLLGRRGHVLAVPGGFQLYCICESKQAWTWAKKKLAFASVTQDGDEEGCLFMDRLPTENEAAAIRDYVGIAKRPEISAEERERRRSFGERLRKNFPSSVEPVFLSGGRHAP
jgi:hypothetical protein